MMPLEEITIKVPANIAQRYRSANAKTKREIESQILFFLQQETLSPPAAISKLRHTMREIGQQAVAQGLTSEILDNLLSEED